MRPSEAIKPISYLKAHASEIIREIKSSNKTFVITQNGEAKAILQDVNKYEQTQESLCMLKILALSNKSLKKNDYKSTSDAFDSIRTRIQKSSE